LTQNERITKTRRLMGLTQAEMAVVLEIPRMAVCRMEQGLSDVKYTAQNIEDLASIGVSVYGNIITGGNAEELQDAARELLRKKGGVKRKSIKRGKMY